MLAGVLQVITVFTSALSTVLECCHSGQASVNGAFPPCREPIPCRPAWQSKILLSDAAELTRSCFLCSSFDVHVLLLLDELHRDG